MKYLKHKSDSMNADDDASQSAMCEAFLREFSQERDFIAAYIRSLLPNASDAEDVLQRCSLLLWQKFPQFDGERSFRAWACGVAFYEVRNFTRSANQNRLHFNVDLMSQIADQRLVEADQRGGHLSLLQSCLKLLKPEDRELIHAAYDKTRSHNELAALQGLSVATLNTRIWRLRKMLQDCVHRKLSLEEQGDV